MLELARLIIISAIINYTVIDLSKQEASLGHMNYPSCVTANVGLPYSTHSLTEKLKTFFKCL